MTALSAAALTVASRLHQVSRLSGRGTLPATCKLQQIYVPPSQTFCSWTPCCNPCFWFLKLMCCLTGTATEAQHGACRQCPYRGVDISVLLACWLPGPHQLYQRVIDGEPTSFSFSMYLDQTLIFITQLGTAGTILAASQDAAFDGSTTYTTAVLLGKRDEPLLQLCARQIVEMAGAAGYKKPMVIGLGFKQHSMQLVKQIMQTISADNVWS